MSIRVRRKSLKSASAITCATIVGLLAVPVPGQTVELSDASLTLQSVDALGNAILWANNGTLALGSATFAKPPFSGPYFRNPVITAGSGLILGDGKSFTLSGNLSGLGAISVIPSTFSVGTWTLAGNNAAFTGGLNVQGAPGATQATLNMLAVNGPAALGGASGIDLSGIGAAVGFVGGAYTVGQPITTTGGTIAVFDAGSSANITLAGPITGAGPLTRSGTGVLTLAGTNTFGGGFTFDGGITLVSGDGNLGQIGMPLTLQSGALLLGPGFTSTSRALRAGNGGAALYVDSEVSWTGPITNNGIIPGSITKSGAGNLTLTNNTNSVGSFAVNGGTMTIGGVNGRLLTPAGSIQVHQSSSLVIDNTAGALARLSNNASIGLSGGTLRLIGNATVNTSLISTGTLQLGSPLNMSGQGISTVLIEPGVSAHALVRFASPSRAINNGGQFFFRGAGMGVDPVASLSAGKSNMQFTSAPALTNGILPYAIIDNGTSIDLASYSAANGVIPATYDSTTINNGSLATANVMVGSDISTGAGSINAIKLTGGTLDLTAGTLQVTSGAMLVTGPTTITGGTLTFGTGTTSNTTAVTANLYVHADTTIASRLAVFFNNGAGNPSGLAKSGTGVLTLSGVGNTYAGPTRVLEGTLRLGAPNVIPDGSSVILNPGAVFDLNGFSEAIGSLNQLSPIHETGNNGYGTVIVGSATLTLTGDGAATTSIAHDILGTGTIIKNGAGTFTVYGQQAFSGTVTIGNGTVALATQHGRGTGLSNVSRFNLGVAGVNAHSGLRVENGATGLTTPIVVAAPAGRTATLAFADGVGIDVSSPITLSNAQGLLVDASGGPTLSGLISGPGPITYLSTGLGLHDSEHYSIRVSGANSYTGATVIAAKAVVLSHPQALGVSAGAVLLGSAEGGDNPELSADAAITFSRPFVVQNSLNDSVVGAAIGSRVAAGGGTATFSGTVNIAGNRSRLTLFSTSDPVNFTGGISGATPVARVRIGQRFTDDDITARSTVILSGANTYAGGTTLAAGTLGINGVSVISVPGNNIINSPIGTGPLTIGDPSIAPGHRPTLAAIGSTRTIFNDVILTRDFIVDGAFGLTLAGPMELGDATRTITVNTPARVNVNGVVSGGADAGLTKMGPGPLTLSAANTLGGGLIAGEGTLTLGATHRIGGTTHVADAATLRLATGSGMLVSPSLSIDGTGVADVTDRGLVIDYPDSDPSPLALLTARLASGFNGGAWNGPGIHSTTAAGESNTGVGIVEASDVGAVAFLGESFTGDAVLIRHTLYGDANLSGNVDIGDFALLAANFNQPGGWFSGDFNYDGTTGIADFALQASNFNLALSPARPGAVPEPSGLGLFTAVAVWFRRRRQDVSGLSEGVYQRSNP